VPFTRQKRVVRRLLRTLTPENAQFTTGIVSLTECRFEGGRGALHLCIIQIVINLLQFVMRRRFNLLNLLLFVVLLSGCAGVARNTEAGTSLSISEAYRTVLSTLTMPGE
jgi:hypothetical protein